ncbi:DNA-directed DNA polymerase, partial [Tanacetum coccineum]
MNERRSAVLLNKLPSKEKDPGSFTIPCDIGQLHIDNAFSDLGASISLMPYTSKIGQSNLADPITFRVWNLQIDFVILDMPEDSRVPIILGRPFLATARAMIDVFNKKITLRVGDDEVVFDVDQSIKRPTTEDDECYGIDDLDETINEEAWELLANEEPDSFLSRELEKSINQSDLECCESTSSDEKNGADSEKSMRRIDSANTPYSITQATINSDNDKSEHLYSANANEIDKKKPELKNFPQHLEYAYLHGDESFPIIISSELSEKEKVSLLQVLERRKGAIAWKMSDIKGIRAENLAADHLSRLENPDLGTFTEEEITDEFPNEHLMILKAEFNNDEPWRCVAGNEILEILGHCHYGPTRGHHSGSITGRKVYESGFYWPNIFKDAKDYVMSMHACQDQENIHQEVRMPQNKHS